jgi:hypothetical protein
MNFQFKQLCHLLIFTFFCVSGFAQSTERKIEFDTVHFNKLLSYYGADTMEYAKTKNAIRYFKLQDKRLVYSNGNQQVRFKQLNSNVYCINMLFEKDKIAIVDFNGFFSDGFKLIEQKLSSKGYKLYKGTYLEHWNSPDGSHEIQFFSAVGFNTITIRKKGLSFNF